MCEYFYSSFPFFSILSQSPPRSHLPLLNSSLLAEPPPRLLSSPTVSSSSSPFAFSPPPLLLSFALFHFISFHQPAEQKRNSEVPRAVLSITTSLNVRTRSLLLLKAHRILTPRNAVFRTRCSGNVAECVVINCAEIYGLHKVLLMPVYVRSLAGPDRSSCSF